MNVTQPSLRCANLHKTSENLENRGFSKVTLTNCARILSKIVAFIKRVAMTWTAFFVAPARPIGAILAKQIKGELLGCRKAVARWIPKMPKSWQQGIEKAIRSMEIEELKAPSFLHRGWIAQEIQLEVDGLLLDIQLLTNPQHLTNRWMLYSGGNAECIEMHLPQNKVTTRCSTVLDNAQSLRCQVALFNYPGVGKSAGQLNRPSMVRSYRAVLRYLESRLNELEGAQIIGYGWSMGGAVQAEAFDDYKLNSSIGYALVKDRTFSQLAPVAHDLVGPLSSWLLQLVGWNFCSDAKVMKSKLPEFILQTTEDEIIPTSYSLARAVESHPDRESWKGRIVWTQDSHFGRLDKEQKDLLVNWIENKLPTS